MAPDRYSPQPVAAWYRIAAIGALLFMLIAVGGYLVDVTTNPGALPIDQRVVAEARPTWAMAAYGVAVWVGLVGAILLLFRRKLAQPLMLVSMLAAMLTFLPYVIVPGVRDNVTTNDIAVAVMILIITWTIFWFARHSAQRGWLR